MVNGEFSGPDSFGDQGFLWVLPDLVLISDQDISSFLTSLFSYSYFSLTIFHHSRFLASSHGHFSFRDHCGGSNYGVNTTNKSFLRSGFY